MMLAGNTLDLLGQPATPGSLQDLGRRRLEPSSMVTAPTVGLHHGKPALAFVVSDAAMIGPVSAHGLASKM